METSVPIARRIGHTESRPCECWQRDSLARPYDYRFTVVRASCSAARTTPEIVPAPCIGPPRPPPSPPPPATTAASPPARKRPPPFPAAAAESATPPAIFGP